MYIIPVHSQYSLGVTGLLNIPTADMQHDGTFMAGGNFLPKEMTPDIWHNNTGNYFLNITFLSFFEVAYRCTLMKGDFQNGNKWLQDRSVSVRLRPLKEGRYYPSVVLGSNDAFTTHELNPLKRKDGNRFFSSVYAVATKNIRIGSESLNFSFGSYFFSRDNSPYKGVFGGIKYQLPFFKPVSVIAEYDSDAINIGATAHFLNHFSLHVFSYDFKAVSAGIRYEFCLIH